MRTIQIPETDLELRGVGLGLAGLGLGSFEGAEADRVIGAFLDAGGNTLDTAHVYSDWVPGETARSERALGDWFLRSGKRDEIVLMSKGGHPRLDDWSPRATPEEMAADLDSSLLKLRTDRIDVYFYHRDNPALSAGELVEVMEGFRRAGKIRYYACSNWTVERMREADAYAAARGFRGFVANQAEYSLASAHVRIQAGDTMLVCDPGMEAYHRASPRNLLVPFMGLCGGYFHRILSRGEESVRGDRHDTPVNRALAGRIAAFMKESGFSLTDVLLGFFDTLDFPAFPLAGTSSASHVGELCSALRTDFRAPRRCFSAALGLQSRL